MFRLNLPLKSSLSEMDRSYILSKKAKTSGGMYSFSQIVRVDILAFIIVRLLGSFQHCRSQFGVRHTHCLDFIETSQPTEVDFVLQVVLTNVNQSRRYQRHVYSRTPSRLFSSGVRGRSISNGTLDSLTDIPRCPSMALRDNPCCVSSRISTLLKRK